MPINPKQLVSHATLGDYNAREGADTTKEELFEYNEFFLPKILDEVLEKYSI